MVSISLTWLAGGSVALAAACQLAVLALLDGPAEADAFFAAQAVPMVLAAAFQLGVSRIVLGALAASAQSRPLGVAFAVGLGAFALALSGLVAATAPGWLGLLFRGLPADEMALATCVARAFCAAIPLAAIAAVMTAVCHARRRARLSEGLLLLGTALALGLLPWLHGNGGPALMALVLATRQWLLVVGGGVLLAQTSLAQLWPRGPQWRQVSRVMRTQISAFSGSALLFKCGPVIDRSIASLGHPGAITTVTIASMIYAPVLQAMDRSSATRLVLRSLDQATPDGQQGDSAYRDAQQRVLRIGATLALAVPAICLLAVALGTHLGPAFASLADTLAFLPAAACLMSGAVIGGAVGQLSVAWLQTRGHASVVARLALVGFVAATALKLLGFLAIGTAGLLLGMAAYPLINAILLHRRTARDMT